MKKLRFCLYILIAMGMVLSPFGQISADIQAWRMYGNGPKHTFSSSEEINFPLKLEWEYRTGGGFFSKSGAAYHRGMYIVPLAGGELHAINETTGKLTWKLVFENDRLVSSPAPANDFIVVATQSGKIHVLLASNGSIKWTYDTKDKISNPPMVLGGSVYLVTDNGIALRLTLQGLFLLNSFDFHSQITSQPLFTGKGICCATKNGHLTMLDLRLQMSWSINTDNEVSGTICKVRNTIVFINRRGMMYCYDDNGKYDWQLNIGNDSPAGLVTDGYQIFSCSTRGTVFAVNGQNGVTNWTYKIEGDILSRPVVSGGKLYVCTINRQLVCLAVSDGSLLWNNRISQSTSNGLTASSKTLLVLPRVGDGYCISLNNGNLNWLYNTGGTGKIPPVSDGTNVCAAFTNGSVSLLDSTSGKISWNRDLKVEINASPAMTGNRIIVGAGNETLYCLDYSTGKPSWQTFVPYYVNSPPAVAGKNVFIGTWGGEIISLDASTGQKKWSQPTNAEIKTSPSVALNSVYVGSWDSNIYCYDYQTGTTQWQMSTPYNLNQCLSLGSEQGYIPTKDSVVCVKLRDGVPLWTLKLDSQIVGELAINEDNIFALTNNGYLYCLNGKGSKVWSRKIDIPHISRSICVIGDYICLASGSLIKFYDTATGKLKWQYDNNGINISLPIFSNGRLFFTTDIGSIVCMGFDPQVILSSPNVDLTIP